MQRINAKSWVGMLNVAQALQTLSQTTRQTAEQTELFFGEIQKANGSIRGRRRNDTKKTQHGATHRQGEPFRPANLYGFSPATYRRHHVKNPAKAQQEKLKGDKRKWISAQ